MNSFYKNLTDEQLDKLISHYNKLIGGLVTVPPGAWAEKMTRVFWAGYNKK
jgi:hypothetical protein